MVRFIFSYLFWKGFEDCASNIFFFFNFIKFLISITKIRHNFIFIRSFGLYNYWFSIRLISFVIHYFRIKKWLNDVEDRSRDFDATHLTIINGSDMIRVIGKTNIWEQIGPQKWTLWRKLIGTRVLVANLPWCSQFVVAQPVILRLFFQSRVSYRNFCCQKTQRRNNQKSRSNIHLSRFHGICVSDSKYVKLRLRFQIDFYD